MHASCVHFFLSLFLGLMLCLPICSSLFLSLKCICLYFSIPPSVFQSMRGFTNPFLFLCSICSSFSISPSVFQSTHASFSIYFHLYSCLCLYYALFAHLFVSCSVLMLYLLIISILYRVFQSMHGSMCPFLCFCTICPSFCFFCLLVTACFMCPFLSLSLSVFVCHFFLVHNVS